MMESQFGPEILPLPPGLMVARIFSGISGTHA